MSPTNKKEIEPMKKLICLLLTLSLRCAGIALAEEKVIDPNNLSQSTTLPPQWPTRSS